MRSAERHAAQLWFSALNASGTPEEVAGDVSLEASLSKAAGEILAVAERPGGAYVAAGSCITQGVPEYALGIARGRQINKPGWVKQKGRLKPKDS